MPKIGSMTEDGSCAVLVERVQELNLPSDVVVTAQRAASIYKFDNKYGWRVPTVNHG